MGAPGYAAASRLMVPAAVITAVLPGQTADIKAADIKAADKAGKEDEATTPAVEITHLRKTYGPVVAVDDVSFSVAEGEIFGILGPNGAGKTTTVECAIGLRSPDYGTVRLLGLDPRTDADKIHEFVGVQLQAGALPAKLKVREILDMYRSFYHDPADVTELLEALGLAGKRDAYYRSLSGGQRQRLSVALALIGRPKIAVLDEMTTGLDPQARHTVWDRLFRLKLRGVTLILTTHYMDEAEQLCDRLVVMDKGKIAAEGSPQELIRRYSTREVVELRFRAEHETEEVATEITRQMDGLARRLEALPDRLLLYTDDGDQTATHVHDLGLEPESMLVRRATLEDVFLHLTGRTLVEE